MLRSSSIANTTDQGGTKEPAIRRRENEISRGFPALWRKMTADWTQPGDEARAWLMYSASYLIRSGEVRWAIDPVRLQHRLAIAPSVDYVTALRALSFVLLTHQHGDHLDIELLRSLRHLPITWVVPEALLGRITEEAAIPAKQILVPRPLQPVVFGGIRITPFDGMHWENSSAGSADGIRGVPAMGYLAEYEGSKWLFPGDTRTYAAGELCCFGPVNALFAHVWLGRAAALSTPPLLEAFCQWCLDLSAARVILTHLEEFGRTPNDFWDFQHAAAAAARLKQVRPALAVTTLRMGESVAI